jgi:hypothetical protein
MDNLCRFEDAFSKMERFDDQIMGGISQSTIVRGESRITGQECGVFGGVVRVQGGGFAGCRMKILKKPLDLSDNTGMYIKCLGDGKRYKLNMRSSPTSNEVVYQAEFTPSRDSFSTVRIPFSAFRLVKRCVACYHKKKMSAYQYISVLIPLYVCAHTNSAPLFGIMYTSVCGLKLVLHAALSY